MFTIIASFYCDLERQLVLLAYEPFLAELLYLSCHQFKHFRQTDRCLSKANRKFQNEINSCIQKTHVLILKLFYVNKPGMNE